MSLLFSRPFKRLLKQKQVANAKPDEGKFVKRLLDGAGLYLQATIGKNDSINRNWIFRYELGWHTA